MSEDLEGRLKVSAIALNAGAYVNLDIAVLEGVYTGIFDVFGKIAARKYVQMIAKTHLTSSKQFRQALYALQRQGWKNKSSYTPARTDMYLIEQRSRFLIQHKRELARKRARIQ